MIKKILRTIFLLFIAIAGYKFFVYFKNPSRVLSFNEQKNIAINDNGLLFSAQTKADNIGDLLKEKNIILNDHDQILPDKNSSVFPGENIFIRRAVKIAIQADGQTNEYWTLTKNVRDAILDSRVSLGEDDLVSPDPATVLKKDLKIAITRVEIKEETVKKAIDFKTQATEDDSLGWRIKKVVQKGVPGIKEIKYKVVAHDGKEISRKILEENVVKDPIPEIAVQGTYMKLGKANTGQGTWYAWKGGLFAASTTLPRGSFAKVTNTANGESVVVQINDYGPFGKGRIIDLDKVAFQKIASLGAGVIGVKVEQVLN